MCVEERAELDFRQKIKTESSVNLKIITKLRNRLTPSKNHMLRLHSEAANRLHSRWCGSENSTEAHQALLGGDWWGKRAPERRGLLT